MPLPTPTLCPYCGTGCGLSVTLSGDGRRVAAVAGDKTHPVNRGRTCRKPLELGAAVHAQDRVTAPLVRASRDLPFARASWDDALGGVAARLRTIIDESGPDAVAFYISGQLLTEDYYAVNKLAKGFIGTNNVDSNSRLCMSSAVAGYTGAFGFDGPPPSYADLALADCMLLLGSNTAACHPIVWSRIRDRQAEGARVVVVDPRRTPTAASADLHLAVRPGTDLPLLNAMLYVLDRDGLLDETFIARHTSGWEETLEVARAWPPARAAEVCGVDAADIERAAEWFGAAGAAMTLWSMGANQSTVGTLKNRALINLCLATGNLGRPGCGPLSLTGQPNAMGGREVGGLAHLLPGYRKVVDDVDRAAMEAHWGLEAGTLSAAPGLTATELVDGLLDGRVRAVLVAATNPVVSLPDGARVREAFEQCELLVVQDCHHPTETSALAHVVLPAAAWPEKEGSMTSSERRVGLVRKLLDPPGEARPDWQIYAGLAAALGYGEAFAWSSAADVYDEYAACTAGRPCDVSDVSHERLRLEGSVQWGGPRLYEDRRPPTPDRRARFGPAPHADAADAPDGEFPMVLTTGRVADQWHTMSRTGKSPTLRAAAGVPTLSVHPADADLYRLIDGGAVRVRSRRAGAVVLAVALDDGLPRGVAFAPFHWGTLHGPPGAGALNAVSHDAVDPTSKQPELKAMAVALEPVRAGAVARAARPAPKRRLVTIGTGMAALATVEEVLRRDPDGWRVTMLGEEPGPVYNRIMLSKLLAGECGPGDLEVKPLAWYAQRGIDLRGDCPAVSIDTTNKIVRDLAGGEHPYDALVVATGSRAFVPPMPGHDLPHVSVFRTWADVAALSGTPVAGREALVLGGGLLGLEAAAGLHARGARVTVVEPAPRLMGRQLDDASAAMLATALRGRGIELVIGRLPERITPEAVHLADDGGPEARDSAQSDLSAPGGGDAIRADFVVIAAGVRPEVTLAREAGLPVERGVVVDDALRAGAPGVFAVGECAEHQGMVYGLWAPLAEQARVAGATIAGDPAAFFPQTTATVLKVAGLDVYAGGVAEPGAQHDEVTLRDTRSGKYRKLVLQGDRLVGAILVGDVADARRCTAALKSDDATDPTLIDGGFSTGEAPPPDPDATICSCNAVTAGEIDRAIAARGLTTLAGVQKATRASTGCGGCAGEVRAILERHRSSAGNRSDAERQLPSPTMSA